MSKSLDLLEIISVTSKLKVLYVEDDEDSRSQSLKLFENYFDKIDIAQDGKEGLDRFKEYYNENKKFYDLVISDIRMPLMDGITMCKEIYKINEDQNVMVISAYSDKEYLIELINMGVDGFLQKPFSFEQVMEALMQFSGEYKEKNNID